MSIMVFSLKNVIFFVLGLSIIFYAVHGFEITTSYFSVKNRTKDYKKCTGKLFSKQVVHSFRVSDMTGECEEMKSDDIKEDGYFYVETDVVEKKFTKWPVENFEDIFWQISKGIRPGFRFDLNFSVPDGVQSSQSNTIDIRFWNASHGLAIKWWQDLMYSGIKMFFEESDLRTGSGVENDTIMAVEGFGQNIVKFSVLAQSESLKIMFDNQELLTYHPEMINIHGLHEFQVKYVDNDMQKFLFHRYWLKFE